MLLCSHSNSQRSDNRSNGRKGILDAIAGLNLAIDILFEHTDFNKVSRKLYRQRLEGTLKPKQEEKLRELGMKL
jgi:hypothetical protein